MNPKQIDKCKHPIFFIDSGKCILEIGDTMYQFDDDAIDNPNWQTFHFETVKDPETVKALNRALARALHTLADNLNAQVPQ